MRTVHSILMALLFTLTTAAGAAVGEEIKGVLVKIEDRVVSYTTLRKPGESILNREEFTLPLAKDAKIMKAKYNLKTKKIELDGEVPDGVNHKQLKDVKNAGGAIGAIIITDEGGKEIKELQVFLIPEKK
jgi:hypothetical protein